MMRETSTVGQVDLNEGGIRLNMNYRRAIEAINQPVLVSEFVRVNEDFGRSDAMVPDQNLFGSCAHRAWTSRLDR